MFTIITPLLFKSIVMLRKVYISAWWPKACNKCISFGMQGAFIYQQEYYFNFFLAENQNNSGHDQSNLSGMQHALHAVFT